MIVMQHLLRMWQEDSGDGEESYRMLLHYLQFAPLKWPEHLYKTAEVVEAWRAGQVFGLWNVRDDPETVRENLYIHLFNLDPNDLTDGRN